MSLSNQNIQQSASTNADDAIYRRDFVACIAILPLFGTLPRCPQLPDNVSITPKEDQLERRCTRIISHALELAKIHKEFSTVLQQNPQEALNDGIKKLIHRPWFENLSDLNAAYVLLAEARPQMGDPYTIRTFDELSRLTSAEQVFELLTSVRDYKSLCTLQHALNSTIFGDTALELSRNRIFDRNVSPDPQKLSRDELVRSTFLETDSQGTTLMQNLAKLLSVQLADEITDNPKFEGRHKLLDETISLLFYADYNVDPEDKRTCIVMPHLHYLMKNHNKSEALRIITTVISSAAELRMPDASRTSIPPILKRLNDDHNGFVQNAVINTFVEYLNGKELYYDPESHIGIGEDLKEIPLTSDITCTGQAKLASALFQKNFKVVAATEGQDKLLTAIEDAPHPFKVVNILASESRGHTWLFEKRQGDRIYLRDFTDYNGLDRTESGNYIAHFEDGTTYRDGLTKVRIEDKSIGQVSMDVSDFKRSAYSAVIAGDPDPDQQVSSVLKKGLQYVFTTSLAIGVIGLGVMSLNLFRSLRPQSES